MALSRDQILQSDDRQFDTVDVPEWDGEVRIASMSLGTYEGIYKAARGGKDTLLPAKLVAASVVDDQGELIFSEDDVKKLMEKNISVMRRVVNAVMRLNGATQEQIEDLEKNLRSGRNAA